MFLSLSFPVPSPLSKINKILKINKALDGSGCCTTLAGNTLSTAGLHFSPLEDGNNFSLGASEGQRQFISWSQWNPEPGTKQ